MRPSATRLLPALAAVAVLAAACGGGGSPARRAASSTTIPPSRSASSTTAPAPSTTVTSVPPSTTSTTAGASLPVVDDCGTGADHVRPTTITLACADAGVVANDLVWSSWTSTQAVATGQATVNDCTPNCATGHDQNYPAQLTLGTVAPRNGHPVFTEATLTFTGPTPPGMPRSDDYPIGPAS